MAIVTQEIALKSLDSCEDSSPTQSFIRIVLDFDLRARVRGEEEVEEKADVENDLVNEREIEHQEA